MPLTDDSDNVEKILAQYGWYVVNGHAEYLGRGAGAPQWPDTQHGDRAAAKGEA